MRLLTFDLLCEAENERHDFREDIQVLRAVAVVLVIAYHLGLMPAGYLGVDIFFVISGYLMTKLYPGNVLTFYRKRIRKLALPYLSVVSIVLFFGYYWLLPHEYGDVLKESIAAFGVSNIYYWLGNDYFLNINFQPLIHLWSLGVEIQFYLLFPLIMLLVNKHVAFIWGIGIFSMAVCMLVLALSPKTAFYLLPLRLWEFCAGVLVYQAIVYQTGRRTLTKQENHQTIHFQIKLVVAFGLLLILTTSPGYERQHPGVIAAIVVMLTSYLLYKGFRFNGKLWSSLVWVGNSSYSLYLVHFPIIAFAAYSPFVGHEVKEFNGLEFTYILLTIFIASLAINRITEWCTDNRLSMRRLLLICSVPVFAILLMNLFSSGIHKIKYSEQESKLLNSLTDSTLHRCNRVDRVLNPFALTCQLNEAPGGVDYLLVGDSHLMVLGRALKFASNELGLGLWQTTKDSYLKKDGASLLELANEIRRLHISKVIVHNSSSTLSQIKIRQLIALGEKIGFTIFFIDPVPVWSTSIPKYLWEKQKGLTQVVISQSAEDYQENNKHLFAFLELVTHPNFVRISVKDIFCDNDCKFVSDSGEPYYFDDNHLSNTGANLMLDTFNIIFNE